VGVQMGSEGASSIVGLAGVLHLPLRGSSCDVLVSRVLKAGKGKSRVMLIDVRWRRDPRRSVDAFETGI
jgi:hypothetical protein